MTTNTNNLNRIDLFQEDGFLITFLDCKDIVRYRV